MTAAKPCKDCRAEGVQRVRPTPWPGPRCDTHHRQVLADRRVKAHGRHVERLYGITEDDYDAVYASQDGRCFICRRSTGRKRRLAVDHDHECTAGHAPDVGCRECVRCLACKTCNRIILGRYGVEALKRAIQVLEDPPARRVLRAIMEVK